MENLLFFCSFQTKRNIVTQSKVMCVTRVDKQDWTINNEIKIDKNDIIVMPNNFVIQLFVQKVM